MHPLIAFVIGNFYALCGMAFVGIVNSKEHCHRWHRNGAFTRAALVLLWPLGSVLFFGSDSHGRS